MFKEQSTYYSDPDCTFVASKDKYTIWSIGCGREWNDDGETLYRSYFCDKGNNVKYYYNDPNCSVINYT